MSINDEYEQIISDIEKNISNEKEFQFVKDKITKLTILFMNTIDNIIEGSQEKINNIEEKQISIQKQINIIQNKVDDLEKDFYEDEDYEFDVICPYCNHQFTTDIDLEENSEIKCPECKNIIELDWNEWEDKERNFNCSCNNCTNCKQNNFPGEELNNSKSIEIDLDNDEDM